MTTYCNDYTGNAAKLYYNTGTDAVPVWVEVTEARDMKLNLGVVEIDDTDRGSTFELVATGKIQASITGQLSWRTGSTNNTYLRARLLDRCAFLVAIMTGNIATTGEEGLKTPVKLIQHDIDFAMGNSMVVDFTLKPAYYEEASAQVVPAWEVVS